MVAKKTIFEHFRKFDGRDKEIGNHLLYNRVVPLFFMEFSIDLIPLFPLF